MCEPLYDINNSLGFLTITTNRLMSACFRKRLVEGGIDITAEQWGVLAHLWNQDSIPQDELTYALCVDKSSLSRVLDLMERRGLVRRERDPEDARRKILFATPYASEFRDLCLKLGTGTMKTMLNDISDEDLEVCLKVLAQVKKNIRAMSE